MTPEIEAVAHARGLEAVSNRSRGMLRAGDPAVFVAALRGDFVVVTENHMDYLALARARELTPGLILLNASGVARQVSAFCAALDYIERVAASVDESPADWCMNRWTYAASSHRCTHGWTYEDPPTP